MEELKNVSVPASELEQEEKKAYVAPEAKLIMLEPQEKLAAWDRSFHTNDANRWALNGWGYSALGHDPTSAGIQGTITPEDWTLQEPE